MTVSRFVLVGGICALLNNALVIGFAGIGLGYVQASCLAFGPVLVVGYGLHAVFSFNASASWSGFARYSLAMLANFPLWIAGLYVQCGLLGSSATTAAPVTTGLLLMWNYLATRWAMATNAAKSPM
jgi:putative flippase GtrA